MFRTVASAAEVIYSLIDNGPVAVRSCRAPLFASDGPFVFVFLLLLHVPCILVGFMVHLPVHGAATAMARRPPSRRSSGLVRRRRRHCRLTRRGRRWCRPRKHATSVAVGREGAATPAQTCHNDGPDPWHHVPQPQQKHTVRPLSSRQNPEPRCCLVHFSSPPHRHRQRQPDMFLIRPE